MIESPKICGALLALMLIAGGGVLPAQADRTAGPPASPSGLTQAERQRFAIEAPLLGSAHALEHIWIARHGAFAASGGAPCGPHVPALVVDTSTPPPLPGPTGQNRCLKLPPQPSLAAAAREGRWSTDYLDLPHYAIHAALLSSGKVMFWGFNWTRTVATDLQHSTDGVATLWDPSKGAGPSSMRAVDPPLVDMLGDGTLLHVPIYCSGQSVLPDGRLLVTGGTLDALWWRHGYPYPPGHRLTMIFDPVSERWSFGPRMSVGRWYPTVTELADGRQLILGGFNDSRPNDLSSNLDVISADGRLLAHEPSADRRVMLFPALSLMPTGNILLAGPFPQDSALLNPNTMRWQQLPPLPSYRGGANLVAVPTATGRSPQAMLIGGTSASGYFDHRTTAPAFRSTLVLDVRAAHAGWRYGRAQNRARYYPNTVLLPDGSMVTVGGGAGVTPSEGNYTSDPLNRHVELWNPATGRWSEGAAQREDRTYHSVALLLPDGRVWSAGDDANPNRDGDTAELYQPPYLFRGPRPRILSAPRRIGLRTPFKVVVQGPVPTRVTMLAPSAVTHAIDMHQRFVELHVLSAVRRGTRTVLTVGGPRSRAVAPPGPWMLFAVTHSGVPSVARWTQLPV